LHPPTFAALPPAPARRTHCTMSVVVRHGFFEIAPVHAAQIRGGGGTGRAASAPPGPRARGNSCGLANDYTKAQIDRLTAILRGEDPAWGAPSRDLPSASAQTAGSQAAALPLACRRGDSQSAERSSDAFASRDPGELRQDGDIARAVKREQVPSSREAEHKRTRPCKAKRDRIRKALATMEAAVASDPDLFVRGCVRLPASLGEEPRRRARIMAGLAQVAADAFRARGSTSPTIC